MDYECLQQRSVDLYANVNELRCGFRQHLSFSERLQRELFLYWGAAPWKVVFGVIGALRLSSVDSNSG